MKTRKILPALSALFLALSLFSCSRKEEPMNMPNQETTPIQPSLLCEEIPSLPDFQWQKEASFPDRLNHVDDTLAMNSILSFRSYEDQGFIYLKTDPDLLSFDLYVNAKKLEDDLKGGHIYKLDISNVSLNGLNQLQISDIQPEELQNAIHVCIPYPELLQGSPEEEGFHPEAFELISDLIESDIEYGFPGAQLAIISHGKLIYAKTWGFLNAYEKDGTKIRNPIQADNNTMYDLASLTKMFATNYAIQKLLSEGKIALEDKAYQYLGERFFEDTLDSCYDFGQQVSLETMKTWKASITIADLLKHQAGFPPSPRYFNIYVDAPSQDYLPEQGNNLLYAGSEPCEETRQKTIQAICETPLIRKPGTKYQYSDVDYMILGHIVEIISGLDLDSYLKENFFKPLDLRRISFAPLSNGFSINDCAATELNGNSRDGAIDFPGIRTYTLQGEVHDEMAFYSMNGISGHAGLFSNATDLAKLAYVMLSGGYGPYRFFDPDVIDAFISPIASDTADSGLGWARQGNDRRSWYFGSDSSSFTFGHQGWTGTLVMIDPQRELVMVYLTNERNTRLLDPEENANDFNGLYYTASTLGFVPQIFSIGLKQEGDITPQLQSLLTSMRADARRLIPQDASKDHPAFLNYLAKCSVEEKWKNK